MQTIVSARAPSATPRHEQKSIAVSTQMLTLFEYATHVAATDAKVLITGESGVGKDVIARHIHAHSPRSARTYVAVNCAGVTESLLESELFGHVKGSFTVAYRDKPGKLQLAHGGTLFLDELGEMSPRMQGLLLRFLESGEYFLTTHDCGADFREFRNPTTAFDRRTPLLFPASSTSSEVQSAQPASLAVREEVAS